MGVAMMANRFLATRQVGFLLGYLGHAGARPVRHRAAVGGGGARSSCSSWRRTSARRPRSLGIPLDDFRTWIALHEATHAFELEAHPWLRPYLRERLERQIGGFMDEARELQAGGIRHLSAAGGRPRQKGRWSASCRPSSAACCVRRSS